MSSYVCKLCKSFFGSFRGYYHHVIHVHHVLDSKRGIAQYIAIFILGLVLFSFMWAIFGYEVFPQYQAFQVSTFPTGVYDTTQLNVIGQMMIWFPLIPIWAGALWLWVNASNKTGGADYPSG